MATTFRASATDSADAAKSAEVVAASGEGRRAPSRRGRAGTLEDVQEASAEQTVLAELRALREEMTRREDELVTRIERQAEQLRQLQESQLSRFQFPLNNGAETNFVAAGEGLNTNFGFSGMNAFSREQFTYKFKPDTFDGTASLREFLAQFNLVARANRWDDGAKAFVLASNLREEARSVLESIENLEKLEFPELVSKLELRFGENLNAQNYYTQFTSRKQNFGEDFAALGADLERLSRLAYPECPLNVRDKIACAQFVSAISDNFIKRTLQLEGITSLRLAIERAKAIKIIHADEFQKKNNFESQSGFENRVKENGERKKEGSNGKEEGKSGDSFLKNKNAKECWKCGGKGHFRVNCPENMEKGE